MIYSMQARGLVQELQEAVSNQVETLKVALKASRTGQPESIVKALLDKSAGYEEEQFRLRETLEEFRLDKD